MAISAVYVLMRVGRHVGRYVCMQVGSRRFTSVCTDGPTPTETSCVKSVYCNHRTL